MQMNNIKVKGVLEQGVDFCTEAQSNNYHSSSREGGGTVEKMLLF